MWFWFSVLALLAWSGSDLFSKIGCVDAKDKYSHLKMAMAVGIVMGIHAAYEIYIGGVEVTAEVFIKYLPVSALYILSMTIGYLGLRYIELSVSSPICNSSGAIVAILTIILGGGFSEIHPVALIAVALVSIGVIALGFVESNEDEQVELASHRLEELLGTLVGGKLADDLAINGALVAESLLLQATVVGGVDVVDVAP